MNTPEVRFTRRRYGRQTFTWAEAMIAGTWVTLGDPWPGVTWPQKELQNAIASATSEAERTASHVN